MNSAIKRMYRELLTGAWVTERSVKLSPVNMWRELTFKLFGRRGSVETATEFVCIAGEWNYFIDVHYLSPGVYERGFNPWSI
jgi:hypothetical protein